MAFKFTILLFSIMGLITYLFVNTMLSFAIFEIYIHVSLVLLLLIFCCYQDIWSFKGIENELTRKNSKTTEKLSITNERQRERNIFYLQKP